MQWPPPEHEAEFQAMKAKDDLADRKGMAWAVVICLGFYAVVGAVIYFLL